MVGLLAWCIASTWNGIKVVAYFLTVDIDVVLQVEQPGANKAFSYNVSFEPDAAQEDLFEFSGIKKLVEMAVNGWVSWTTR